MYFQVLITYKGGIKIELYIFSIITILLICLIAIIICFKKICKFIAVTIQEALTNAQLTDENYDKEKLTSYELERLEREEEFDKRIEMLKEEMSMQQVLIHKSTTADELHPLVHNLPHGIVQTKYDVLPDVEVAD